MTIQILISEKNRLNRAAISINTKFKRLTINQPAFFQLIRKHGTASEYVQILLDVAHENKGIFWIRFCDGDATGSFKLESDSKGTRTSFPRQSACRRDYFPEFASGSSQLAHFA